MIELEEKKTLSQNFKLIGAPEGDPTVKLFSDGLSILQSTYSSMLNVIKNEVKFDEFVYEENRRIQTELAAEGGVKPLEPDFTPLGLLGPAIDSVVSGLLGIIGKLQLLADESEEDDSIIPDIIPPVAVLPFGGAGSLLSRSLPVLGAVTGIGAIAGAGKATDWYGFGPLLRKATGDESWGTPPKTPTVDTDVKTPTVKPTTVTQKVKAVGKQMLAPISIPLSLGLDLAKTVANKTYNAITGDTGMAVESYGAPPKESKAKYMSTVYNAYKAAGLTHEGAKTMVAQINRENHFNPKYLFGGHLDPTKNAKNLGMFSWQKDRGRNLYAYLSSRGLIKDGKIIESTEALRAQVDFSMIELRQRQYKRSLDALINPKLTYKEIESIVGDNYVRWRRTDPKYRASGYRNQDQGYAEISALTSSGYSPDMSTNYITGGNRSGQMLLSPLEGRQSDYFGKVRRGGKIHKGIDIAVPIGTPVRSSGDGRVVRADGRDAKGWGNVVFVRHAGGLQTVYGHLSRFAVKVGDPVKSGQVIAYSGNTGGSTGPHLHLEVWKDGNPVDPKQYIGRGVVLAQTSTEVASTKKQTKEARIYVAAQRRNAVTGSAFVATSGNTKRAPTNTAGAQEKYKAYLL